MRSQPKGTRRFKVELKITAMSWAVYKPQDHGKFMLEGTSGALYPVILLISRLNFSFFFFHFMLIICHPPTRHLAVKSLASSLWWTCGHWELLLGTSQVLSSPGWTRAAPSACLHILKGQVLPPWASWWPLVAELSSVHWCLPLDAFQRWSLLDFDPAVLHVMLSHYMLSADQEQPQQKSLQRDFRDFRGRWHDIA